MYNTIRKGELCQKSQFNEYMDYLPYWITKEDENGNLYSCDMIRMNLNFGKDHLNNLHDYLEQRSYYQKYKKTYTNIKQYTYRYMHTISCENESFMLAYGFNGNNSIEPRGVIEFNPNKLSSIPEFQRLYSMIIGYVHDITIVRYDLAIDLPLNRQYVSMPKQGNLIYKTTLSDSYTESLGRHNNNGFTKVYDKKKEAKLNKDITRIEITLNRDAKAIEEIPRIYIKEYQIALRLKNELSQNDSVFLQLLEDVEDPFFYMKKLTSRKRQKFLPYLSRKEFVLDSNCAEYIRRCVINIEKVRSIYEAQC